MVGSKCIQETKDQSTVHAVQTLCTSKTIYFLLDICTVGTINYMTCTSYMCDAERNLKTLVFLVTTRKVREPCRAAPGTLQLPWERPNLPPRFWVWAAQSQGRKRRLSPVKVLQPWPPPPLQSTQPPNQDRVTGLTI